MDAFELWYWRRLLRVPWPARRSNQSILKEISPEYSLEGLMLKLKLQYFGHLMWRTDLFEKTLMLGKIEGRGEGDDRVWDGWMASPTHWTWIWVNSGSWWWTWRPGMLQSMGSQESDTTEQVLSYHLLNKLCSLFPPGYPLSYYQPSWKALEGSYRIVTELKLTEISYFPFSSTGVISRFLSSS